MWIITRDSGIINAHHVTRFLETNAGTAAYCGNLAYHVSDDHCLDIILTALKQGVTFLEVK